MGPCCGKHLCDVASLKASLAQGREGKWEGKGTPELTDLYLLTGGSGGKGCYGCQ
jgi:hypothetical protein